MDRAHGACPARPLHIIRSCRGAVRRPPCQTVRCDELAPLAVCDLASRAFSSACPLTLNLTDSAESDQGLWQTCALVSSGGELRGSRCGDAIDRHASVFRFNFPKLRGFDADVGRRTTLMLVNEEIMRQIILISRSAPNRTAAAALRTLDARGADILYPKSITSGLANKYKELTSGSGTLHRLARLVGGRSLLTAADTPLPDLSGYPAASWFASLQLAGAHPAQNRHHYLSTGMRGLLLATASCRSLTIFGFGLGGDGNASAQPANLRAFHYWEPPSNRSLIHGAENMSFEHVVVDAWRRGESLHVCPLSGLTTRDDEVSGDGGEPSSSIRNIT